MQLHEFFTLDFSDPASWLPATVGAVTAGLVVLGSRTCQPNPATETRGLSLPPSVLLPKDPFEACLAERRGGIRCGTQPLKVTVADAAATASGWVLDRSQGGLGVSLPALVQPGRVLRIRRADAPHRMPWVDVQVRYCRQQGSKWAIGGKFVDGPMLSALLFQG
jgi:hypothetical protein